MTAGRPEQTFALGGILFLSTGFLLLSVAYGLSISSLSFAVCGMVSHFLYRHINRYHFHLSCDYIPSGEVLPALVLMTFLSHAGFGIATVSVAGFTCILLSCLLLYFVQNGNRRSPLTAGTCMNVIFILALLFGFYSRGAFPALSASTIPGGILRAGGAQAMLPAVISVIIIVSLLIAHSSRHLGLYSLGSEFFRITGYSYRAASICLVFFRSVLLLLVVTCGGLLYGWLLPLPGRGGGRQGTAYYLAGSFFPFSCLLLISVTAGIWIAVLGSILLSYLHLAYNLRG